MKHILLCSAICSSFNAFLLNAFVETVSSAISGTTLAVADYGMLTILKTSEEGGLQIHLDGTWIDVEPIPGEDAPSAIQFTNVTLF